MKCNVLFIIIFLLLGSVATGQIGVSIVFKNETKQNFEVLNVNIAGKKFSFKNLKYGERTNPIIVPHSYGYCYAQAITSSKDTLLCQPQDYVGETLYSSGKLLMTLMLSGEGKKDMYVKLEKEKVEKSNAKPLLQ